jgi:hypothetical protein
VQARDTRAKLTPVLKERKSKGADCTSTETAASGQLSRFVVVLLPRSLEQTAACVGCILARWGSFLDQQADLSSYRPVASVVQHIERLMPLKNKDTPEAKV